MLHQENMGYAKSNSNVLQAIKSTFSNAVCGTYMADISPVTFGK